MGAMVPYVVRQGDHMKRIALARGCDADAVWNHKLNADLRQKRASMDMLCSGDVLYLPEPKRQWLPVASGTTNRFVATVPRTTVTLTLSQAGSPIANAACVVRELPSLGPLTTSDKGLVTFEITLTTEWVTLDFESTGLSVVCRIGHLDPIETLSGVRQRLRNLGYPVDNESGNSAELQAALCMFQNGQSDLPADGSASDETCKRLVLVHGS
jgi:hypothetical protein